MHQGTQCVFRDAESERTGNATASSAHSPGRLWQGSDTPCLEDGDNHQTPKDWESVRQQQLQRHHTTVNHQQGFQPHHSPTHHNSTGQTMTPRTNRHQEWKIMHRPHPCAPPDPWTVTLMEQLFARDVRGLWKDFWQIAPTIAQGDSTAPWNSTEICEHLPGLLRKFWIRSHAQ